MKLTVPLFLLSAGALGWGIFAPTAQQHHDVNYDRDVAPILSQHCFKCHGPDATKAAAGLRLDSFAAVTKDKAIVPGSAIKSFLIDRVSDHDPASRMPPQDSGVKPLTPEQIETLKTWINQGARYEKHWSYVPPTMPAIPTVSNPSWCKNPIDRFVMAKMDAAGIKPEPEADKDTLALRASLTLTGLPPAPADLKAFQKDQKPGAYERYVDRLLASPTYGEHEARYWLDAVRYGDTHGLQLDNERSVYPYRDWVIRAFNQDLPFTKFVEWQLAGDLLPYPTTEQLIATGYVRMNLTSDEGGAIPEEFLARNTFDRVDTTSTVMLGLTVQCARCHDHKYDPIKQKDYYGMYAFFDSTKDEPLDGNIALPPPYTRAPTPEQESQLNAMARTLAQLRSSVDPSQALAYFKKSQDEAPTTKNWEISPVYTEGNFDAAYDKVEPAEPDGVGLVHWKPMSFELGKAYPGIIGKDSASVYVRGTITVPIARTISFGVSSDDSVKVWLNRKLIHANKTHRGVDQEVDAVKGNFKAGDNEIVIKVINDSGPDGLKLQLNAPNDMRINAAVQAFQKTSTAKKDLCDAYLEFGPKTSAATKYRKLLQERDELEASIPMTLIAQEMAKPRPTFVLKRGLYDQKGDPVTRHVPEALGTMTADAPRNRLGFAQWLVSPSNPLLARVFVNRIWQQHFSIGIVKTVDDFGSQGEWPLNQPLLDYLTVNFERNGWSVKKLNREIVTSAAFRQNSRISKAKLALDPENRLISRGPRFRLDAEVIRDKALVAGGLLVEQIGGKGFKPYQPDGIWEAASDPASGTHIYQRDKGQTIYRRSMYLFWKRTAPPPAMVNLDAPLRDTCIVRRSTTDTPLQALTLQNEPAFLEASRTMAQRLLAIKEPDDKKLKRAYDLAMTRSPKPIEISLLKKALAKFRQHYAADPKAAQELLMVGDAPQAKNVPAPEQASWMLICSTLMNTDEFMTLH